MDYLLRSRNISLVAAMLVVMVVSKSLSFSAAAASSHDDDTPHDGRRSIQAELFHWEHPFSRSAMQQASGDSPSHLERLQIAGKRSHARAQTLVRRKLMDSDQTNHSQTHVTLHTSLTDGAPAEYLMSITLGTPPQKFVAVADTGSDLTWLQCSPCESCYNESAAAFEPSSSSTYKSLDCASNACQSFLTQYGTPFVTSCSPSCAYAYFYGDGSNTTGLFSADTLHLKSSSGHNVEVPDFWFGCSRSSASPSSLLDSADGLVGLGLGLISFPSQLGAVFEDKFSYCLVNRSLAAVQSSPLVFGKGAALEKELQYTPFVSNPGLPFYYFIGVDGLCVGGSEVNYNKSALQVDCNGNGGTIIDSGTTFSYLDPRAFTPLLAAIDDKVPSSFARVPLLDDLEFLELCYDVTEKPDFAMMMPQISFKLANNTSWDLAVDNSWILLPNTPSDGMVVACLGMIRGSEGSISILGNTQQQDFHVLYDRVEKRLGFAPSDCGVASL